MTINWLAEAKKREKDLLKDLQAWIQIPSVYEDDADKTNYPMGKGNRQALDYLLTLGEQAGFNTKNIDNLAGHIEYKHGAEIIGVIGHSDVVPVGDDWDDDPFSGKIADGFMYGRGTQDDKGPMMAAFYALKILKELDLPLTKTIRLIDGTDEESGEVSVDAYFAKEKMPEIGFSPDANFPLIYGEKGILTYEITIKDTAESKLQTFHAGMRSNMVPDYATATIMSADEQLIEKYHDFLKQHQYDGKISQKNDAGYQLEIEGKSAHGSTPDAGINAAYLLIDFLQTLDLNSDFITAFVQFFAHDTTGKKLHIDARGEMGSLSANVGIVTYEEGAGTITLNIRYPHEWDSTAGEAKIKETLKNHDTTVREIMHKLPLYVPQTDPLVQTLADVYRKQTGSTEPLLTTGGGTYARPMKKAIAFGMRFSTTEDLMHQKNERVPLEDLIKATAIYAEALYELAK